MVHNRDFFTNHHFQTFFIALSPKTEKARKNQISPLPPLPHQSFEMRRPTSSQSVRAPKEIFQV